MKTSLKTGLAQIFSCSPQKIWGLKIWGSPPLAPLARTPPLTKLQRITITQFLPFRVRKKYIPFLNQSKTSHTSYLRQVKFVTPDALANHPRLFCSERSVKLSSPLLNIGGRATSLTLLTGKIKDSHAATVKKSYIKYKYN